MHTKHIEFYGYNNHTLQRYASPKEYEPPYNLNMLCISFSFTASQRVIKFKGVSRITALQTSFCSPLSFQPTRRGQNLSHVICLSINSLTAYKQNSNYNWTTGWRKDMREVRSRLSSVFCREVNER